MTGHERIRRERERIRREAKAEALRELADENPTFSVHGVSVADYLRRRADAVEEGRDPASVRFVTP